MGVWIKYKNKVMEVTTFEINGARTKTDKGPIVDAGQGVNFFAPDGDGIVVGYYSKEKAKMVFDKLTERVARLEILTRCIQGFDPEILNENTEDEVTLKALLDLMIFEIPNDQTDPIFKEWEREAKRSKEKIELKKTKAKSANLVVNIDGHQLKNAMTDYNKMVVKKDEKK